MEAKCPQWQLEVILVSRPQDPQVGEESSWPPGWLFAYEVGPPKVIAGGLELGRSWMEIVHHHHWIRRQGLHLVRWTRLRFVIETFVLWISSVEQVLVGGPVFEVAFVVCSTLPICVALLVVDR